MSRTRSFPPSQPFAALAITLATQHADLETAEGGDEISDPLCDVWSETERTLIHSPANSVGDILLKVDVLARIAEGHVIQKDEMRALGLDVAKLNGPGMAFVPEAWLRCWTDKGGGYVRTDAGLSFITTEPATFQQRLLLDELDRAQGQQEVAALIDGNPSGETMRQAWDRLKAAYDIAHSVANVAAAACDEATPDQNRASVEASNQANHHEYVAWCAVMRSPAPDLTAASWKMIELFGPARRLDGSAVDKWLFEFTDIIIDDLARLNGNGGAA